MKRWVWITGSLLVVVTSVVLAVSAPVRLRATFSLRGSVADQNGAPVGGAVLVFESSGNRGLSPLSSTYVKQEVSCVSDSNGRFIVRSPEQNLKLQSVTKPGYAAELADERNTGGWGTGSWGPARVVVYDLRTKPLGVKVQSDVLRFALSREHAVYLDLSTGSASARSESADLEAQLVRGMGGNKNLLAVEIRAVSGGIRLSTADAPYAPRGDYVDGFRWDWSKSLARWLSPVSIGAFVRSQGGKRVSRVDITLTPPSESGVYSLELTYRTRFDGGDYIGVREYAAPRWEQYASQPNVLTIGKWWSHPEGVEMIVGENTFAQMQQGANSSELWALASSNSTSAEISRQVVAKAIASDDRQVLRTLAENPSVPSDVVNAISRHQDWQVREWAASNPMMESATVQMLSGDSSERVRQAIASRRDCPLEVLRRLAKDKDDYVRRAVAQNIVTPLDCLKVLSTDPTREVRVRTALNPRFPDDDVKKMIDREPALQNGTPIWTWRQQAREALEH